MCVEIEVPETNKRKIGGMNLSRRREKKNKMEYTLKRKGNKKILEPMTIIE